MNYSSLILKKKNCLSHSNVETVFCKSLTIKGFELNKIFRASIDLIPREAARLCM